ncbi:conserved hypothetical protein [Acidithiobacillus caldus SM-1]|uniref:Uncharacterized protein n=1 Tax=Acidithiobacillus caldus (strain SM-1) TaxID=990288 RepID=F9ZMY7_ACICS|nr:hypothetical protein [Acidithiobacillus caldus]AEK57896.1 conserved hypothetical protein [Acidithiobacillus caldus SM-1]
MVDEIKRVRLTLAGDQADYVDELAQRYGVARTQVIRVMVDCMKQPELGSVEEQLQILQQSELAPQSGSENPPTVFLEQLRQLSGRVEFIARQIADLQRGPALAGALQAAGPAGPEDGGMPPAGPVPGAGLPPAGLPPAGPADGEDSAFAGGSQPPSFDDVDFFDDQGSGGGDGSGMDVRPEAVADILRAVADLREDVQEQIEGMRATLAALGERVDPDVSVLLNAIRDHLQESFNGLVDAMSSSVPKAIAESVSLEMQPGSGDLETKDLLGGLHRRMDALTGYVDGVRESLLRMEEALGQLGRAEVSAALEERLARLGTAFNGLEADLRPLLDRGDTESRLQSIEEKVGRMTDLLESLLAESSRSFVLLPSKGLGKALVGQIRLVKED